MHKVLSFVRDKKNGKRDAEYLVEVGPAFPGHETGSSAFLQVSLVKPNQLHIFTTLQAFDFSKVYMG